MTTDLILDEQVLTLQAARVRIDGPDLEVRADPRVPSGAKGELRRALAHGEQDQLLVNVNRDYNRTEIHGPVEVRTRKVPAMFTMLGDAAGGEAVQLRSLVGELHLVRDVKFPIDGRKIREVTQLRSNSDSLGQTLRWMLRRLDAIEDRLATLEQRAGLPSPRPPAAPTDP